MSARALALYLLIVQGGMAGGSVIWGTVTEHAGIVVALASAATGLIFGLWAADRYPLYVAADLRLRPALRPHEPVVARNQCTK